MRIARGMTREEVRDDKKAGPRSEQKGVSPSPLVNEFTTGNTAVTGASDRRA